jgi:putative sugar O-methyltransferase
VKRGPDGSSTATIREKEEEPTGRPHPARRRRSASERPDGVHRQVVYGQDSLSAYDSGGVRGVWLDNLATAVSFYDSAGNRRIFIDGIGVIQTFSDGTRDRVQLGNLPAYTDPGEIVSPAGYGGAGCRRERKPRLGLEWAGFTRRHEVARYFQPVNHAERLQHDLRDDAGDNDQFHPDACRQPRPSLHLDGQNHRRNRQLRLDCARALTPSPPSSEGPPPSTIIIGLMETDLQALITEMGLEVEGGPVIYRPSRFWESLAGRNTNQLAGAGFDSFKRTVNQNYFNWLVTNPRDAQFRSVVISWMHHPTPAIATARLLDGSGVSLDENRVQVFRRRRTRIGYSVFVAMLWEHARRRDRLRLLEHLSEPELGSPILVRHRGRAISQDLANSVLEFYSISEAVPGGVPEGATVVELGGGYGRLGWLLLSAVPRVRYIAVDIPPALAVAQRYLTCLFPDLPVARFRRGTDGLSAEIAGARMAFITPNQLEALPDLEADLFINISSLHEMRPDQIAHYLGLIGRHTRGVFYTKQWLDWTNPDDGVRIRETDYPIPPEWQPVYQRVHEVQTHFFEAAYRVP